MSAVMQYKQAPPHAVRIIQGKKKNIFTRNAHGINPVPAPEVPTTPYHPKKYPESGGREKDKIPR
jgi:hypothetical protein